VIIYVSVIFKTLVLYISFADRCGKSDHTCLSMNTLKSAGSQVRWHTYQQYPIAYQLQHMMYTVFHSFHVL